MRVLHLAAGNRWTGAAAPAFAEVEALREAGVDAHFAYVGGYKLQAKLDGHHFAHPIIAKAQNPASFLRSLQAIGTLIDERKFDIVHTHLTYDHWLGRFAARSRPGLRLARTFHSRRTLRHDPFTRLLLSKTDLTFVINDDLSGVPLLRDRSVVVTPPPLDQRLFTPLGTDRRERYGIGRQAAVLVAIGKVSKGRGFEAAIQTYALVRKTRPDARLLLIGHGEHRPALEELIRSMDLQTAVIWAGYHEDDLAEHYRSGDVLLFTAAGSDEGHRAVIEAMACGLAPATYPVPGMSTVLGELGESHTAATATPAALEATVLGLLGRDREVIRKEVERRSALFRFPTVAGRLINAYSTVL